MCKKTVLWCLIDFTVEKTRKKNLKILEKKCKIDV